VNISVFPPASITPTPRAAIAIAPVRAPSSTGGPGAGTGTGTSAPYVFLEITRNPNPTGIVLEALPNDTYKRIGYFNMGRKATTPEEQRDGFWSAGERDWGWDEGLEMCTLVIV
jgi:hypothetical protein